jgi:hypothetical protein
MTNSEKQQLNCKEVFASAGSQMCRVYFEYPTAGAESCEKIATLVTDRLKLVSGEAGSSLKTTSVESTLPASSTRQGPVFTSELPIRVSITITGHWEKVDATNNRCLLMVHHPADGRTDIYEERMSVNGPWFCNGSVDRHYESVIAGLEEDGFVLVSKETIRTGTWQGFYSVWDWRNPDGDDLRIITVPVVLGSWGYMMQCSALRKNFDQWEPVFKQAIRSLSLPDFQ